MYRFILSLCRFLFVSADFNALNAKAKELNSTKLRREKSFHADKPRKSALLCKTSLSELCGIKGKKNDAKTKDQVIYCGIWFT
jgi:hypothetical protein